MKKKNKVLIIAEIGPNHNGSLKRAKEIIKKLSKTSVDVIKFQIGIPDEVYSDDSIMARYQKENDKSKSIKKMSEKYQLQFNDHIKLYNYCRRLKLKYACSAFDIKSLAFINKNTNLPFFKIPSGEINSTDILNYISKFKKKILLSTGMASLQEIKRSYNYLKKNGNKNICIMHCVSSYPAKENAINLEFMETLKKNFNCDIGYSDHTTSSLACISAVAKGAKVIEKHVTLSKKLLGPDHKTSYSISEFKKLVKDIRLTEEILGENKKKFTLDELNIKKVSRKSCVTKNNIKKNSKLKRSNIVFKRPGTGISPFDVKKIIGKKTRVFLRKNTVIKNHLIN